MNSICLLIHHTHTFFSEAAKDELKDFESINHFTDYIKIVEKLPKEFNVIFTRTEHYKSDPKLFDQIEMNLEDKGYVKRHTNEGIFYGELDGKRFAIINGVETSLKDETQHVTLVGLALDDDQLYHNLSADEICRIADENSCLVIPAHPFMPKLGIKRRDLDELIEKCSLNSNINLGLGYTTGYTNLLNKLAVGEYRKGISALQIANQYDINLIPESDLHVCLPTNAGGLGVLNEDALDKCEKGEKPWKEILNSRMIKQSGLNYSQFFGSYPDLLPGYRTGFYKLINKLGGKTVVPYSSEDFKHVRERNLNNLSEIDVNKVKENIIDID